MGLEILSDLSEILPYPIPDFPLYAESGNWQTKTNIPLAVTSILILNSIWCWKA